MKRLLWSLVAAAAVTTAAAAPSTGAPGRVIDRTFSCATAPLGGGLRDLDVSASRPIRDQTHNWFAPAYMGVGSGPDTLDSELVYVRARSGQPYGGRTFPPGVYANAGRCSATRTAVPLSPKGLPGPPVQWDKRTQCRLPGRVLIRVRAVLESPALWAPAGEVYRGARMNVVEAALAVRTSPGRRPVVLMEIGRSGKTRTWLSSRCD